MRRPRHDTPQIERSDSESGMALILVMIFTILVYVLVAELVTTAQMARMSGDNDSVLQRMRDHQLWTLTEIEQLLKDDLATSGAGAGAEGGGQGGAGAMGALGGEGGEEEVNSDSSQDAWFRPTSYSEEDLTTNVWVEDENRKFNILTMVSADENFARESKARFSRLIDGLREGTQHDLTYSDGEQLGDAIIEWMRGRNRNDAIPRPPLKSDDPKYSEITLPLHLDEIRMLRNVTDDLFFDRVQLEQGLDKRELLGLESVLTIYTSLKTDPGDPEKMARQQALQQRTNRPAPGGTSAAATGPGTQGAAGTTPGAAAAPGAEVPEQPLGVGVRININTAHRCVLRALMPINEIPDVVIDAIIRYRNEEQPEEEGEDGEGLGASNYDIGSDISMDDQVKKKIFKSLADLEELPEFANLPDLEIKGKFLRLLTTESHVFSIHMASMVKRDEEARTYVMRRTRTIMVRLEGEEEAILHPLILLEDRHGLRIFPVDLPTEHQERLATSMLDMDYFTREERDWNPFFLEFYLPKEDLPYLPPSRYR